jgi:hypothetical protein
MHYSKKKSTAAKLDGGWWIKISCLSLYFVKFSPLLGHEKNWKITFEENEFM